MLPIVHNVWDFDASELERYFRDHPEPLVRALAERLVDTEEEIDGLHSALSDTENNAHYWEGKFEEQQDRNNELLEGYDKLARRYAKLERKLETLKHYSRTKAC